jgi:hypothetical protein
MQYQFGGIIGGNSLEKNQSRLACTIQFTAKAIPKDTPRDEKKASSGSSFSEFLFDIEAN